MNARFAVELSVVLLTGGVANVAWILWSSYEVVHSHSKGQLVDIMRVFADGYAEILDARP
jgi:hypothetical protein